MLVSPETLALLSCSIMPPKEERLRLEARAAAAVRHSVLAHVLPLQTLLGFCRIQHAQEIAALAINDIADAVQMGGDLTLRDQETIAKLGSKGRYTRNMCTEFIEKFDPSHFKAHVTAIAMKNFGNRAIRSTHVIAT